jgi:Bacterial Ig domain
VKNKIVSFERSLIKLQSQMKLRIIYSVIALVVLLSCEESKVDTIVPAISEAEKTVSVTFTNIPTGSAGASAFLFSINSDQQVHAVEKATAKENVVVKIMPPDGVAPFDVVAFIPDDSKWTTDKGFTSGKYSRVIGQTARKGAYLAIAWVQAANLASAAPAGISSSIEAVLSLFGSATPTTTNFEQGTVLTLDAAVRDNIRANIATVAFLLGKSELKSYTTAPFRFQFNTASVALGSHTLYVKATNGIGDVALDSIKIFLSKTGNMGPSITFNGLVNLATFVRQDVFTINTTVSDPDDGIDKVEFKINNVLVSTDRTSPYSFFWDTFNNAVGAVVVEVTAFDRAGQARSDVVNVRLTAPANYIPRVSFTSPANGLSVTAGTLVSLGATATDTEADPINGVAFIYQRVLPTVGAQTLIGARDTTSPYGVDFVTTGLVPGTYNIFAQVFDNDGRSSFTAITIIIN